MCPAKCPWWNITFYSNENATTTKKMVIAVVEWASSYNDDGDEENKYFLLLLRLTRRSCASPKVCASSWPKLTNTLNKFTNMKKQSPSCLKWRFPITWSIQGRNPFSLSQTFDQSPCHWSRPPIGCSFFQCVIKQDWYMREKRSTCVGISL